MSERDWTPGNGIVMGARKPSLQEIFPVSQQIFTYCVCWVFSAEINLETGVYRANYFHMNSDLQLMDEVKPQKSSLRIV